MPDEETANQELSFDSATREKAISLIGGIALIAFGVLEDSNYFNYSFILGCCSLLYAACLFSARCCRGERNEYETIANNTETNANDDVELGTIMKMNSTAC